MNDMLTIRRLRQSPADLTSLNARLRRLSSLGDRSGKSGFLLRRHPRKPGVNPWRQALVVRDPSKQRSELLALPRVEGRADRIVVGLRDAANVGKYARPHVCHMQRVKAPVFRVVAALEHPAILELVNEGDESARKHPQHGRQFLLADARASCNSTQDPRLRRNQANFGESLREARGSVGPNLREQERRGTWVPLRTLGVRSISHALNIAREIVCATNRTNR